MHVPLKSFVPLVLALVVGIVAGCADGRPTGAKPTKPVKVTVTYKGSPVEGATVSFISETPAYGRTDTSGVAKMKTYVEGDGAVLGAHKVTISKTDAGGQDVASIDSPNYNPDAPSAPIKHLVPVKYSLPDSGLTAEVTEGGPNEFKFELTD
jgi:hypothetical protein